MGISNHSVLPASPYLLRFSIMKIFIAGLLLFLASTVNCGRILVAAPFGSKSHQNGYIPLIKKLAQRGHYITLITNYEVKDLNPLFNVEQIELDLKIDPGMFGDAFKDAIGSNASPFKAVAMAGNLLKKPFQVANTLYSDQRVLQLMKTGKFDMVMASQFFGSTAYPLAWHFNATLAIYSPGPLFPGVAYVLGDSDHTEYVPNPTMELTNRMNLPQRVLNTVSAFATKMLFSGLHKTTIHSVAKTVLPNCPPLDDIEKEISLVFTNSHPIFHYPRAKTPEMIEIGGIHCRTPQPLPLVLDEFVGKHEPGFIIFAVGSALRMNDMPPFMVEAFVQVFSQLPQRVIWQWKGKQRTDLPANIMTVDWLPQQDLLGHKNCRLFMTHGGLNSLIEAVYHGVPVLGLPLTTDQFGNLARVQREGYGNTLLWKDITKDSLQAALHELLINPKYLERAGALSQLMRDDIMTPLDRAVYWTEFNLRHNGAKHLRLGSRDLAFYQRAMIDVYGVIAAMVVLPLVLALFIIRKCCGLCFKSTKKNDDKKKQ